MESVSDKVQTTDPQRDLIYESERELTKPVGEETLPLDVAQSAAAKLWEETTELPVSPPSMQCMPQNREHMYYAWDHEITFASREKSVPTVKLLHELAHARLAALGIGPFISSHGRFFVSEFGRMWAIYTQNSFHEWRKRCAKIGLTFADRPLELSEHSWALVEEGGKNYAVRPAQKAVEVGWNVVDTFSLNVKENHPMAE